MRHERGGSRFTNVVRLAGLEAIDHRGSFGAVVSFVRLGTRNGSKRFSVTALAVGTEPQECEMCVPGQFH